MNVTKLIQETDPDVLAYIAKAATEIANHESYHPRSEEELTGWISDNSEKIVQRASKLLEQLYLKFLEHKEEVVSFMSEEIYDEIHSRYPDRKPTYNPQYVLYAKQHGKTPEEMREKEPSMVGYICWSTKNRVEN